MPDETQQPLIEIPEEDELLQIANSAVNGQFGTEGDGDMPDWDLTGADDGVNTRTDNGPMNRRTPMRGAVAYLYVGIPMSVYHAFTGYDEQRHRVEGDAWDNLREEERITTYLEELVGRDMQADERRPPADKVYWFAGLYRGQTFKSLVEAAHAKDDEAEFQKRNRLLRAQQRARFRERMGSEWTDDQIDEVLGPLDTLED